MKALPDYNKINFAQYPAVPFEEILPDVSPDALDLLKKFLIYKSKDRMPAREVSKS